MTLAERATRPTLSNRTANGALYLAGFVSSWNSVTVGGVNIVDLILPVTLFVTLVAWLVACRRIYIEGFMVLPLMATVIIAAWDAAVDPSANGDFQMIIRVMFTTTIVAVLITSLASTGGRRALTRALAWWVFGVGLSALAAVLTTLGIISFDGVLEQTTGSRANGLANHPNSLAFSICIALPVAVYLVARAVGFWRRSWWVAVLVSLTVGLVLSESRAGLLVGFPVLVLSLLVALRGTRFRGFVVPIALAAMVAAILYLPDAISGSRLAGGAGALSDMMRERINGDAWALFARSPLVGEGFNAQTGVAVPLTVLTAGGIVLTVGYYAFVLRPVPVLWRGWSDLLAKAGLLSLLAFLGFGLFNPVFMERATYWPILIPTLWLLLADNPQGNPWGTPRLAVRPGARSRR